MASSLIFYLIGMAQSFLNAKENTTLDFGLPKNAKETKLEHIVPSTDNFTNSELNPSESHSKSKAEQNNTEIIKIGTELIKQNSHLLNMLKGELEDKKGEQTKITNNFIEPNKLSETIEKAIKLKKTGEILNNKEEKSTAKIEQKVENEQAGASKKKSNFSIGGALTDLLYKSTIPTKNGIINKEDSSILIENNRKLKTIISQIQNIFDLNKSILDKFLEPTTVEEEKTKERPKDIMKYQVIEITDNKNK